MGFSGFDGIRSGGDRKVRVDGITLITGILEYFSQKTITKSLHIYFEQLRDLRENRNFYYKNKIYMYREIFYLKLYPSFMSNKNTHYLCLQLQQPGNEHVFVASFSPFTSQTVRLSRASIK